MAEDAHYDKASADYAVGFIECLCHTKGTWAGKPFELIDWQERIIRDIFGILKPNGYRQFNTAYIEIGKKNGKSELAATVALLLCCGDGEERAEVYGCAADRQQASIVFEVAADMVRMCPALSKRVKILASQKRMVYLPTNSFYQVLSAEAYSKHGFNIHGVVFDELHTQPNRKLFDVMTKGSGDARMQPLYFLITTAGTDTQSICYETHQKAKDILEGRKIDSTFYPVIYGAKENEDWTDPEVWKRSNPSLGITVGIDKVQAACDSARQNPAEENSFRQLRLNQWVKQSVRWMPMDKWDACSMPVDAEELEGRVCYGGLDLSSTMDITAFVLVFPPIEEDEPFAVLPYFWIPEENIDLRVRRDHVPYDVWEKQGFLMTTEGNVVHYGFIEAFIERLGEKYNIREIAFDRWGAVQMVQNLEGMGFTVVPFGQGFKDKFDGEKCTTPHVDAQTIEVAFVKAVNLLITERERILEDCAAIKELLFSTEKLEKERTELQQEIDVVSQMIQDAISENARIAIDQTDFQSRYESLVQRFDAAKAKYDAVCAEMDDKRDRRAIMEQFLEDLARRDTLLTEFEAEAWHALVDFVTIYAVDDIRVTFKNGKEIRA